MAAPTANGWPRKASFPATMQAPTGQVCPVANKDVGIVMAYVAWRLHTEVMTPMTSAYGGRTTSQQISLYRSMGKTPDMWSNHISGTACDFAKPGVVYEIFQHGRYRSGYTRAEEARIRAICRATKIIQWGADYPAGVRDPVHFQLRGDLSHFGRRPISRAKLRKEARRIGKWVRKVQRTVGVKADGFAGPGTIAAVKKWQRQHDLTPDGAFGPASQRAAGWGKKSKGGKHHADPPRQTAPARPGKGTLRGLDVSSWQTVAEWRRRKPAFLIAKAHEGGTWHDPAYTGHRDAARRDGVLFGAYSFAWTNHDPEASAADFLAYAGLRRGEIGVLDFEPYKALTPESTWPAWVIRWGSEYRRRRGHWPMLYCNHDLLGRLQRVATPRQMDTLRKWPLWLAAYNDEPGSLHGWPRLTMWQHTDKPIDQDIFYGNAAWWKHLGGATPSATATARKDTDMPDDAPTYTYREDRPLTKGWHLVRIDTVKKNGNARYSATSGPCYGSSGLYLSLHGLEPGQTVQVRAVDYAKKDGKWTPVKSYGVSEHTTTSGATLINRTQNVAVGKGHRLRWEVNVPADCTQHAAQCRNLIWKGRKP